MPKKRHSAERIITKLREAEVLQAKGQTLVQVCKALGVTQQTYYRWRKEYGGPKVDQAKRLKALERENSRLKKVVADQALDIAILKEVAEGNF
ncbi:MAG: transposase [Acidobacteriota bacterium]|nr:MAG: transposase [Acidobacteriota bacterium]